MLSLEDQTKFREYFEVVEFYPKDLAESCLYFIPNPRELERHVIQLH